MSLFYTFLSTKVASHAYEYIEDGKWIKLQLFVNIIQRMSMTVRVLWEKLITDFPVIFLSIFFVLHDLGRDLGKMNWLVEVTHQPIIYIQCIHIYVYTSEGVEFSSCFRFSLCPRKCLEQNKSTQTRNWSLKLQWCVCDRLPRSLFAGDSLCQRNLWINRLLRKFWGQRSTQKCSKLWSQKFLDSKHVFFGRVNIFESQCHLCFCWVRRMAKWRNKSEIEGCHVQMSSLNV